MGKNRVYDAPIGVDVGVVVIVAVLVGVDVGVVVIVVVPV
jgi:hypothetical protein